MCGNEGVMNIQPGKKVSVIIPTYNRANSVGIAIGSILNQTWQNFEIIVVDDGSTDHTKQVVEGFEDDRIRYVYSEQNSGASHARNTGIGLAEGEFIAFLDSDDEWLPEKLEKQMQVMMQAPDSMGMVYCRMRAEEGEDEPIICPPYWIAKELLAGNILAVLLVHNLIGTPSALARKACLEQVGGFNEKLSCLEDWELNLRIAEKWKIGFVDEILVEVHPSSGSVSSNARGYMETRCYLIKKYWQQMRQNNILEEMIQEVLKIAKDDGYYEEAKKLLLDIGTDDEDDMNSDRLKEIVDELLRTRVYDRIEETLLQYRDIATHDNDLATVYYLLHIYKMEKAAGQETILEKTGSVSALIERFTILKLYLRRFDFNCIGESLQDFYQYVAQNKVSAQELLTVADYSVVHKKEVLEAIQELLQKIA